MKMKRKIKRVYLDEELVKKMKLESIEKGFPSLIDYSTEIARKDDPIYNMFKSRRKNGKNKFDFP